MVKTVTAEEYAKLLDQAEKSLLRFPHLEPSDFVADVILEFGEAGKPYHLHEMLNLLRYKCKADSLNKVGHINPVKFSKSEKSRVCSCCHEEFPIAAFYLVRRKDKKYMITEGVAEEVGYYCRSCQVKKNKERYWKMKALGMVDWAKRRANKKTYDTKNGKRASRERQRKYKSDPEKRAKHNERQKLWARNNKAKKIGLSLI